MTNDVRPDVPLGRRSPQATTRIVVADRNVITRVGLRSILERNTGMAVVAEATSYDAVLDSVDEHGPDVLIIGVGGVMSAEDAVSKVRAGADVVQIYTGLIYEGPALVVKAAKAIKAMG